MSPREPAGGPGRSAPSEGAPDRVAIGEIVGPFGHRGEVKVYPYTDFPERLTGLKTAIVVGENGEEIRFPVRRARPHKNVVVMRLDGVGTMDEAENLRGRRIVVNPEERHPLPDGTFYVDDLVGMRVRTDDGRDLGAIRQVLKGPANDNYDLGYVLIPATREVVLSVNLSEGIVMIHPIPGLLDEPEIA